MIGHWPFDIPVAGLKTFKPKNYHADALAEVEDVSPPMGVTPIPLLHPGRAHIQVYHHLSTYLSQLSPSPDCWSV